MAVGIGVLACDAQGNVVGMYMLRHTRVSEGGFGNFLFKDGVCGPVPGSRALRKLIAAIGQDLQVERVDVPAVETPPAPSADPPPRMKPRAVTTHDNGFERREWQRPGGADSLKERLAKATADIDAMDRERLLQVATESDILLPDGMEDDRIRELLLSEWRRRNAPVKPVTESDGDEVLALAREFLGGRTREQLLEGASRAVEAPEAMDDAALREALLAELVRERDRFRAELAAQSDQDVFDAAAEAGIRGEGGRDELIEKIVAAVMIDGMRRAVAEEAEAAKAVELAAAMAAQDGRPAEPSDLDAMDKAALMALATDRGVAFDGRWGEKRIREVLLEALTAPK